MITFLWMLYLAFMLFMTSQAGYYFLLSLRFREFVPKAIHMIGEAITVMMWAIWYMYFLH